jgi:hypothetical protein
MEPKIVINGWGVTAVSCHDKATAIALAEKKIREIEARVKEIKTERTELNRHKHILLRWLCKPIIAVGRE